MKEIMTAMQIVNKERDTYIMDEKINNTKVFKI